MKFKDRINELTETRGMSQKELSLITGISEPTVSNYVRGTRTPNCDNLIKLAKALGTSTDYLLGCETDRDSDLQKFTSAFQEVINTLDIETLRKFEQAIEGLVNDTLKEIGGKNEED